MIGPFFIFGFEYWRITNFFRYALFFEFRDEIPLLGGST